MKTTLGQLWEFGTILAHLWDLLGTSRELLGVSFGTTWGQRWDFLGTNLGLFDDNSGTTSELLWDYLGTSRGLLGDYLGTTWRTLRKAKSTYQFLTAQALVAALDLRAKVAAS